MLSAVFIDRPRLAVVISVVITLAGLIALTAIPIAQFPNIVPPQVEVSASYPGASAEVVEAVVAQPIESRVVGVDKMLYMKSTSGNDGSYSLSVTFAVGTDPDINTVHGAEPRPPRRGTAPAGSARSRHQGREEIVGHSAGHRAHVAGRALRPAVPEQLRDHQHHRSAQAHDRRRRCVAC